MLAFIKKHFRLLLVLYCIGMLWLYHQKVTHPDSLLWLLVWYLYRAASYIAGIWLLIDWAVSGVRHAFFQRSTKEKASRVNELEEKRLRALDPNTTPQELMLLTHDFPREVSTNPVMPLLSLEDPAFYQELLQEVDANLPVQEIKEKCDKLNGIQLRRFSAECAERAVTCLEAHLPNEQRPRRMLALAHLYARPIWQHRPFAWEKRRSIEAALRFVEGDASEEDVIQGKATHAAQENLFNSHSKSIIEELQGAHSQNTLVMYIATKAIQSAAAAVCGYAFYTTREVENAILVAGRITHIRLPPQQREEKAQAERLAERQWQLDTLNKYLSEARS
jgi:hypothetical protein